MTREWGATYPDIGRLSIAFPRSGGSSFDGPSFGAPRACSRVLKTFDFAREGAELRARAGRGG